jgi:hypothetical protein
VQCGPKESPQCNHQAYQERNKMKSLSMFIHASLGLTLILAAGTIACHKHAVAPVSVSATQVQALKDYTPPSDVFPDMTGAPATQQRESLPSLSLSGATVAPTTAAALPHCPNLPPVCKGGLVSQHSTSAERNAYVAKYSTKGCRWMQPPRCGRDRKGGTVQFCIEECTP